MAAASNNSITVVQKSQPKPKPAPGLRPAFRSLTMKSALQRARTFLTPSASSTDIPKTKSSSYDGDAFTTAPATTALFPTVDPAVDGDDCARDCATCTIAYPKKFSIDEDDQLYGQVKAWHTHMLVATGKTDWVRDVTDERGSVMEAVGRHGQVLKNGKLMLSACDMPVPCDAEGQGDGGESGSAGGAATTVLLLPSWTVMEGVRPGDVPELLDGVVGRMETNVTPLSRKKMTTQAVQGADSRLREMEAADNESGDEKKDGEESPSSGLQLPAVVAGSGGKPPSQDPSATTTSPNGTVLTSTTTTTTEVNPPTDAQKANPELSSQPSQDPSPDLNLTLTRTLTFSHAFATHPSPHLALILMCSQKTRDARCGQSAPLLRRELERHLRPLGLFRDAHDTRPGGVGIYFISHVGGHKYSANVMVYRRRGIGRVARALGLGPGAGTGMIGGGGGWGGSLSGTSTPMSMSSTAAAGDIDDSLDGDDDDGGAVQGIWLARVRPEDCEGIVKYTVLQGKVVKPERQLRGGFDRERGLVSW